MLSHYNNTIPDHRESETKVFKYDETKFQLNREEHNTHTHLSNHYYYFNPIPYNVHIHDNNQLPLYHRPRREPRFSEVYEATSDYRPNSTLCSLQKIFKFTKKCLCGMCDCVERLTRHMETCGECTTKGCRYLNDVVRCGSNGCNSCLEFLNNDPHDQERRRRGYARNGRERHGRRHRRSWSSYESH